MKLPIDSQYPAVYRSLMPRTTTTFTIRLKREQAITIEEEAKRHEMTLNAYIVALLKEKAARCQPDRATQA